MPVWPLPQPPPIHNQYPIVHPVDRPSAIPYYVNAVYYPNYSIYRPRPPSSLSLDYISHVFYAFAWYVVPRAHGTSSVG